MPPPMNSTPAPDGLTAAYAAAIERAIANVARKDGVSRHAAIAALVRMTASLIATIPARSDRRIALGRVERELRDMVASINAPRREAPPRPINPEDDGA